MRAQCAPQENPAGVNVREGQRWKIVGNSLVLNGDGQHEAIPKQAALCTFKGGGERAGGVWGEERTEVRWRFVEFSDALKIFLGYI